MQGILQLLHGLNFVSHARSCPIMSSVQLPINFNLIFVNSGRKQIKHFILQKIVPISKVYNLFCGIQLSLILNLELQ